MRNLDGREWLSVDTDTNLYFEVGNGPFNANTNGTEYGDSFVKLSASNKLAVADYFTPFNQASLASADADLGAGGPLLLPDSVGSALHPHLIVGCGKEGKIYLLDRDNLGHFRAYNATNVAQELYNSSQNLARDNPGGAVKMTVPAIVNGKVYVGAKFALSVFGNGVFLATPTITPNGGIFTNSVTITLDDTTPGVTLYYTLNGTTPTTNSLLYNGSFVLTNSTAVQVVATKPGSFDSAVVAAGFLNNSAIGSGTGLTGSYYSNHFAASPFTGTPTLVRTDATVNFD